MSEELTITDKMVEECLDHVINNKFKNDMEERSIDSLVILYGKFEEKRGRFFKERSLVSFECTTKCMNIIAETLKSKGYFSKGE